MKFDNYILWGDWSWKHWKIHIQSREARPLLSAGALVFDQSVLRSWTQLVWIWAMCEYFAKMTNIVGTRLTPPLWCWQEEAQLNRGQPNTLDFLKNRCRFSAPFLFVTSQWFSFSSTRSLRRLCLGFPMAGETSFEFQRSLWNLKASPRILSESKGAHSICEGLQSILHPKNRISALVGSKIHFSGWVIVHPKY